MAKVESERFFGEFILSRVEACPELVEGLTTNGFN